MKKFFIFVAVLTALVYWFKGFVQSGRLEKYIDTHPNVSLNAPFEYYWGMLLNFSNHKESAVYRLSRVTEKYPESEYATFAWVEYIEVLDGMGQRNRVLEESKKFMLSSSSSTPKAEIIKRKIAVIERGI